MPDVDLLLREMVTTAQIEALGANRIDLGLVRLPIDRRGLGVMCVQREPLMVAVPQNHPLAKGGDPTVRDLDRQDFIMYSPTENRYFHDRGSNGFQWASTWMKSCRSRSLTVGSPFANGWFYRPTISCSRWTHPQAPPIDRQAYKAEIYPVRAQSLDLCRSHDFA